MIKLIPFKTLNRRPELPNTSSRSKSVVFLTMHKAGSVYVTQILRRLLNNVGMPSINFAGQAFKMGVEEGPYCVERSHLYGMPGYFFGAFRGPYVRDFVDLSSSRIVIQVRDPRDGIVSLYFSYLYSHREPGKGEIKTSFLDERKRLGEMTIDDYAIERATETRMRIEVLKDIITKYDDHLLLRYEDMVTDFEAWLSELVRYLDMDISPRLVSKILTKANFNVMENPRKHIRQITPGDHKRKLKSETQASITDIMSKELKYFGYT